MYLCFIWNLTYEHIFQNEIIYILTDNTGITDFVKTLNDRGLLKNPNSWGCDFNNIERLDDKENTKLNPISDFKI